MEKSREREDSGTVGPVSKTTQATKKLTFIQTSIFTHRRDGTLGGALLTDTGRATD